MTNNFYQQKEKFFNLWAPYYDCWFTTFFYQAIHQRLLEYVELKENASVLDLGYRGEHNFSSFLPWIGKMRFYNRQQRERSGTEAGLSVIAHHYLLPGILLTIFSTRTRLVLPDAAYKQKSLVESKESEED